MFTLALKNRPNSHFVGISGTLEHFGAPSSGDCLLPTIFRLCNRPLQSMEKRYTPLFSWTDVNLGHFFKKFRKIRRLGRLQHLKNYFPLHVDQAKSDVGIFVIAPFPKFRTIRNCIQLPDQPLLIASWEVHKMRFQNSRTWKTMEQRTTGSVSS